MRGQQMVSYARTTAVHEAGHAVAYCRFFGGIYHARIAPRGTKLSSARGPCFGYVSHPHQRRTTQDARIRTIMCLLAGPVAQARYERRSLLIISLTGGADDYEQSKTLAKTIEPMKFYKTVLDQFEDETRTFLSEPGVWDRVLAVADVLMRTGEISGDHELITACGTKKHALTCSSARAARPQRWPRKLQSAQ